MRRFRVVVVGSGKDFSSCFVFGGFCFSSSTSVVFTPGSSGKQQRLHSVRFNAGDLHQYAIKIQFSQHNFVQLTYASGI